MLCFYAMNDETIPNQDFIYLIHLFIHEESFLKFEASIR